MTENNQISASQEVPNSTGRNQRRVRNYFIHQKYQLKIVFWLLASSLVLTAINSGIFFLYLRENYIYIIELVPMSETVKSQLYSELRQTIWILAGVVFGYLNLIAAIGLTVSHRTAGPLYRLRKTFEEIKSGKFQNRVKFRPGDDFQEIAVAFNEMMDVVCPPKGEETTSERSQLQVQKRA